MNYKKYFKVIILFVFMVCILNNNYTFALQAGEKLPVQDQTSIIKVGQIAPDLILPVLNEQEYNIDFKIGKPTVIISLSSDEYISKIKDFQKIYITYQNKVRFFIVTPGERQEVEKIYKKTT